MSSNAESLKLPQTGILKSHLTCFLAMVMWACSFPIAEVMLESWETVGLVLVRQSIAALALFLFWIWVDGWHLIRGADWPRAMLVGGLGFGVGGILFLLGQAMSDPVTPAIAAAMMPIIGALLEVLFDGRRMRLKLVIGIVLAISGGLMATGARLDQGSFGWGALICLVSVFLFAWASRATTRDFTELSVVGQTAITLIGGVGSIFVIFLVMFLFGLPGAGIGLLDTEHSVMLLFTALASIALAQFLWIRGTAGLGILFASFHMNTVPFYVMVILVLFLGTQWNWFQAAGAALVGAGVMLAQSGAKHVASTG
ncbi:MAG: DMT family transporter [Pseudomonadota bacterium]